MAGKTELVSRWFISIGLVIFVIHNPNQPFIKYAFLPSVGMALLTLGTAGYLMEAKLTKNDLGNKAVWIPLSIITLSIMARPLFVLITGDTSLGLATEASRAILGLLWFGLYIVSRKLGSKLFSLFTPAIIVVALSTVYSNILNPGIKNGGLVSPTNYDMATGFLVFGLLVSSVEKRWWLSAIALIGLFFTGADEAVFAVGILFLIVLFRHDWSKRILLPIGALVLTVAITWPFGIPQSLYSPTVLKFQQLALYLTSSEQKVVSPIAVNGQPLLYASKELTRDEVLDEATGYRWLTYWRISPVRPLGYGYNINNFYRGIPHNVVLIIIEQVGILAALAWLWVVGYGIFKTKWVYAWVGILALSVFDHYIWTQAAPWFWALAGISKVEGKKDLMFK